MQWFHNQLEIHFSVLSNATPIEANADRVVELQGIGTFCVTAAMNSLVEVNF